jgi:hypothetical protein
MVVAADERRQQTRGGGRQDLSLALMKVRTVVAADKCDEGQQRR